MFKKIFSIFAMILFVSSSFASETITINTAKGEAGVPQNPQKVAVFDLGVLENLELLGISAGAVVDNLYSADKEQQYKDTTRVGTLFEPNLEKLIAYEPDLIIIATRSAKHLDSLNKIAPTIDMTIAKGSFIKESEQRFLALAKIFNKSEQATAIVANIDKKLSQVQILSQDAGTGLFVLTMGPKISAYGQESRFGWIHKDIGIAEAIKNVKETTHGDPVSFEFIREANPDWLIVFDRAVAIGQNAESAQSMLDNDIVAQTTAWKKKQIVYVEPSIYLAVGSMRGIEKTIDRFIDAFKTAKTAN